MLDSCSTRRQGLAPSLHTVATCKSWAPVYWRKELDCLLYFVPQNKNKIKLICFFKNDNGNLPILCSRPTKNDIQQINIKRKIKIKINKAKHTSQQCLSIKNKSYFVKTLLQFITDMTPSSAFLKVSGQKKMHQIKFKVILHGTSLIFKED